MAMSKNENVNLYLHAGTRENTRTSYRSAIRHFYNWGGALPCTSEVIASYLSHFAESLAISTLKQRLSALSRWHIDQGFTDPTKSSLVKKVLRGIQFKHPRIAKQAKPFQLEKLEALDQWFSKNIEAALLENDRARELKYKRNRAIIFLGFWKGLRGDELIRLRAENIEIIPGEGMSCFLGVVKNKSLTDPGTIFKIPALSILCPVSAYQDWISASQISTGPVFRSINQWGHLNEDGLHIDSLIPLIRDALRSSGIEDPESYSGHSFRRGFASWASDNGWDIKTLMGYVGWKSVQSALRYIDAKDVFSKDKIETSISRMQLMGTTHKTIPQ